MQTVNPQLPYYVLLFVLAIILRAIRVYRNRPVTAAELEQKKYRWNYSHFGFELVNVSAGIFILLSERATQFVSSIMIFYVILVILSIFFEDQSVDGTLKTVGHIFLSLVVFGVTYYAFLKYDGLKQKDKSIIRNSVIFEWKVAMPYIDASLNRNLAAKTDPILNIYTVKVEASSRDAALSEADKKFYSDLGPTPFVNKTDKNRLSMITIPTDAVIEKVKETY